MIENLVDITADDLAAQIAFLKDTPVGWLAVPLEQGQLVLKKGSLKSNDSLGRLSSIFGNLDGMVAKELVGLEKFLVKHVYGVLIDPACTDTKSRERILWLRQALAEGSHLPNITVLRTGADMIVDGNKTAAAYHSLHDEMGGEIDLSVYVAQAP